MTVWNDARTEETVEKVLENIPNRNPDYFKEITGLPISPYFSALKLMWLRENVPEINAALEDKRCLIGTIDTWLTWNLTGGTNGGLHITDVTNASRTLLMNLETLEWEPQLLNTFSIPIDVLPKIVSSSEVYGDVRDGSILDGIPISGVSISIESQLIIVRRRDSLINLQLQLLCTDNGQSAVVDGWTDVF